MYRNRNTTRFQKSMESKATHLNIQNQDRKDKKSNAGKFKHSFDNVKLMFSIFFSSLLV